MTDLVDMGFGLYIETVDGEEFPYATPLDMGFAETEVMQVKFEADGKRRRHTFDVEEIETIVLTKTD